jgi:hypothetical protein
MTEKPTQIDSLMIDIETLAVSPNATILTIGAQGFDPFSDKFTEDTYYEKITLESQPNREVDDSTVKWWSEQNAPAQEEAFGEEGRIDIKPALEKLAKMIWKAKHIWANGVTFDMVIIENAMKENGVPLPWKYWQVMDARTIYKLAGVGSMSGTNDHNALADCVNQIDALQKALKKLNINNF